MSFVLARVRSWTESNVPIQVLRFYQHQKRKEWLRPDSMKQFQFIHRKCYKGGLVYHDCFPGMRNAIITADVYCQHFWSLAAVSEKNRPQRLHQVFLQHVSTWTHAANLTKADIQELGPQIIPLHTNSLDLSGWHLFNNIRGTYFDNEDALRTCVIASFLN